MNQESQESNFELRDTDAYIRNDVGYLIPVVLERTLSKFITGEPKDKIVRMNVFMDPVSKKIVRDSIPEPIREQYDDYSIDLKPNV
jgi:hypothetical protein